MGEYREPLLGLIRALGCLTEGEVADFLAHRERFSRPLVISRRKDGARWASASRLLESLGTRPVRFVAVEGETVKDHDLLRSYTRLKTAEKGCLASHLCILALAASHPDPTAFTLVFEDDIVSSLAGDGLKENLDRLLRVDERENAKIVHLGKCFATCGEMTRVEGNIYRSSRPYCAHALAVKNSFAARMVRRLHLYNDRADDLYLRYIVDMKVTALSFHPGLFYQDILHAVSGLRPRAESMGNYTECLDSQVHPPPPPCPSPPACPVPAPRSQLTYSLPLVILLALLALGIIVALSSRRRT